MNRSNELLKMIAEDKTLDILSEDGLVERLDFLLEHNLITVTSDKMKLTDKGQEAINHGIEQVIDRNKIKEQMYLSRQKELDKSRKKGKNIFAKLKLRRKKK